MKALENYNWPGNVRQLRNVVERAVILATGDKITLKEIPEELYSFEVLAKVSTTEVTEDIKENTENKLSFKINKFLCILIFKNSVFSVVQVVLQKAQ